MLLTRIMKYAAKDWQKRLEYLTTLITALVVLFMGLATFVAVFLRMAGVAQAGSVVDLLSALMGVLVCLPMAAAQAEGHISMTILTDRFKGRLAYVVKLITYILLFAVSVVIAWSAVKFQVRSVEVREVSSGLIQWPVWLFRFSCPIGVILFVIRVIQQVQQLVRMGPRGSDPLSAERTVAE
jgi:TRAP-type C4-dicarboxylate transport system permease small subunit